MTAEQNPNLRLGRTETGYIVYVAGRRTIRESRSLHEFALVIVEDGGCTLAIDLSRCDYLDSTFMGCHVDLRKRFDKQPARRFEIIADEEPSRAMLAASHLDTILPINERPPQLIDECLSLAPCELDRRQLGRHIMDCHRRLAELGGLNQEVFSRIADQLELELEKETEKSG